MSHLFEVQRASLLSLYDVLGNQGRQVALIPDTNTQAMAEKDGKIQTRLIRQTRPRTLMDVDECSQSRAAAPEQLQLTH